MMPRRHHRCARVRAVDGVKEPLLLHTRVQSQSRSLQDQGANNNAEVPSFSTVERGMTNDAEESHHRCANRGQATALRWYCLYRHRWHYFHKQGMTKNPDAPLSTPLHPLSLYRKRLAISSVEAPSLPPSCTLYLLSSCYATPSCCVTASRGPWVPCWLGRGVWWGDGSCFVKEAPAEAGMKMGIMIGFVWSGSHGANGKFFWQYRTVWYNSPHPHPLPHPHNPFFAQFSSFENYASNI